MSAISLKSITGITSITTPAGVDDQLTLHNNNTTERVKIDVAGNVHINNQLAVAGVSTLGTSGSGQVTLQYQGGQRLKTHSWGVEVSNTLSATSIVATGANSSFAGASFTGAIDANGDLDVDGHTNLDNVSIAGVSTVTTFLQVLGQAGTSDKGFEVRSNSTQNTDTNKAIRIRNNSNTDTFNISYKGKVTATELDISGNIDVDGHTNLDNVSIAGITTFSNGPIVPNGQYYRGIINSGSQAKIIGGYISGTDTLRIGESMYLTSNGLGIGENSPEEELHITAATPVIRLEDSDTSRQSQIVGVDGNLRFDADNNNAQADSNISFRTDGSEKLRIDKDGILWVNYGNPQSSSLMILDKGGTGEAAIRFYNASANKAQIGLDSTEELTFDVNGSERLRIKSDGKAVFQEEIEAPQDYPNQRPSLDLNFAATKKLDSRITYTRSGRASFINEHGLLEIVNSNVPRFDHDPDTRESKGLLIEEPRTNLLTYSNTKGMSSPNLGGSPQTNDSVNNITLPTGEKGTVRRYLAASGGGGGRWGDYSGTNNQSYTGSVWVRTVSGTGSAIIDINDGGGKTINLTTEWQRVTTTYSTNNTYRFFDIYFSSPVTIYYWGVQIEAGAFVTSYIPTNNATATRGGDRVYIPIDDGLDFYNPVESTILVDYTHQDGVTSSNLGTNGRLYRFRATGGSDTRIDYVTNTGYNPYIASDGVSPASLSHGQSTVFGGGLNRNAVRVKENSFAVSFNGSTVVEDTSGAWNPTNAIDHVTLGGNNDNYSSQLSGHIQRFTYYPVGLSNSQLVTLTS